MDSDRYHLLRNLDFNLVVCNLGSIRCRLLHSLDWLQLVGNLGSFHHHRPFRHMELGYKEHMQVHFQLLVPLLVGSSLDCFVEDSLVLSLVLSGSLEFSLHMQKIHLPSLLVQELHLHELEWSRHIACTSQLAMDCLKLVTVNQNCHKCKQQYLALE